jgi:hypothetical protein
MHVNKSVRISNRKEFVELLFDIFIDMADDIQQWNVQPNDESDSDDEQNSPVSVVNSMRIFSN